MLDRTESRDKIHVSYVEKFLFEQLNDKEGYKTIRTHLQNTVGLKKKRQIERKTYIRIDRPADIKKSIHTNKEI